jgi:hypothetical protein
MSINRRLDALIAILLNHTEIQEATMKKKIMLLISFGFENAEIAAILGTTPGLVAKERYLSRKVKK